MTLERHPGEWTYDPECGIAYIYLRGPVDRAGVALTTEVDAALNLDYDHEGRVVGIEIMATWPDGAKLCASCERCTWNPGPDCGKQDHKHCPTCGHCQYRHVAAAEETTP